jgi:hypothetical protein
LCLEEFVDILNEVRIGVLSRETISQIAKLHRPVQYTDDLEPTCIFPTRSEVSHQNGIRLKALKTESKTFKAADKTGHDEKNNGEAFYNDPIKLKEVLDKVSITASIAILRSWVDVRDSEYIGGHKSGAQDRSSSHAGQGREGHCN